MLRNISTVPESPKPSAEVEAVKDSDEATEQTDGSLLLIVLVSVIRY